MDASRDVMLKVTMGDRSAAAMFSWYLDDTPLAKVRILAASQKQKCLPTLTDQTCVTLPGLSWGWVSPLSPWSRSQGRGRWPAETQGSKTSNKHRSGRHGGPSHPSYQADPGLLQCCGGAAGPQPWGSNSQPSSI